MKYSHYLSALVALIILFPLSTSRAGNWERFTDLNVAGQVYTMLEVGNDLYIGGSFDTTVNGEPLRHIARRSSDGVWHSVGMGVNRTVWALAEDHGSIVVGGEFDSVFGGKEPLGFEAGDIARWTGSGWDLMGGGFREHYQGVHTILVSSNGVYAGGDFETTISGDSVHNIALYDGVSETWKPLGGGIKRWRGALPVWKIAPWQNGIAVAGYFMATGSTPGSGIGLWDGIEWTPMYGQQEEVHTESVSAFNGSIAYTGEFASPTAFVAYDGHSTFVVPSPGIMPGPATVINGSVVVGQSPVRSPETVFNNIAIFNAGTWESVDGGVNNTVVSLAPDKNGSGFLVSGYFTEAGGQPTNGFAIWRPSAEVASSDAGSGLAIFPNPASDRITVNAANVQLLNTLGQELQVSSTEVSGGVRLDISDLASGVYWIRTEKGMSRVVKR